MVIDFKLTFSKLTDSNDLQFKNRPVISSTFTDDKNDKSILFKFEQWSNRLDIFLRFVKSFPLKFTLNKFSHLSTLNPFFLPLRYQNFRKKLMSNFHNMKTFLSYFSNYHFLILVKLHFLNCNIPQIM